MNKTYRDEMRRLFIVDGLPEPFTRADKHLQIFDNYIENTRLRLRSIRAPETKIWTFVLQQIIQNDEDLSRRKIAELYLDDAEHQAFEIFEGREIKKNERAATSEIRKNRYFYEFNDRQIEIDVYLGDLWGLNLAQVIFETETELENYKLPPFSIIEVTDNSFFADISLLGKTFSDIRLEFARINQKAD